MWNETQDTGHKNQVASIKNQDMRIDNVRY